MLQAGCVVRCIAGHDKDSFYAVVGHCETRVLLANGALRKLCKPKVKNAAHVRPTTVMLDMQALTTDKKLREALRPFNRAGCSEEGGN